MNVSNLSKLFLRMYLQGQCPVAILRFECRKVIALVTLHSTELRSTRSVRFFMIDFPLVNSFCAQFSREFVHSVPRSNSEGTIVTFDRGSYSLQRSSAGASKVILRKYYFIKSSEQITSTHPSL